MENRLDIHKEICTDIHKLYIKKNRDYGDSFANLRKRYPLFVCMRVFDKLNRLESCMEKGTIVVKDETIEDTLMDIANYCIMEIVERRADKERRSVNEPDNNPC